MVAPPITEDYYLILEVEQTATPQVIVSSYRRLALKLHPDRNAKHDATEAFQRLGRAYETLNDESKRRAYDLIYPSIRQSRQTPRPTRTTSSSSPQPGIPSEAAQIAAIRKSKQERSARWQTKKSTFDSSIFDLQGRIQQLQHEIKNLDIIAAAMAAAEARKNSWGAWLLSPIYKQAEESEEDKERKSRERQERRIEKDMKERRMESWNAQLKEQEKLLKEAREMVEAADRCDDGKIWVLEARVAAREARARQEKERLEREKLRQQREKQERERQERVKREWEELKQKIEREEKERQERERQRERLRQQERERQERLATFAKQQQQQQQREEEAINPRRQNRAKQARSHYYPTTQPHLHTSACEHHGWWPKVQGWTDCPNCDERWSYLLECPGCDMKRCPKCQAAIRRARQQNRRGPQSRRVRTPSPAFEYWYD